VPQNQKDPDLHRSPLAKTISRQRATLPRPTAAVPSPLRPFTSVFGMGTGVTSSPWSPGKNTCPLPMVRCPSHHVGATGDGQLATNQQHTEKGKQLRSLALPPTAAARECGRRSTNKGQASRRIRTGKLNTSLCVHTQPIEVVVFNLPSGALRPGRSSLGGGLALRCFQRLSVPYIATLRCRWRDSRNTRGTSFPVLSY
jgi:hypothetical protein